MGILNMFQRRRPRDPEEIAQTPVSAIMRRELVKVTPRDKIEDCIGVMKREGVNFLLVAEGDKLCGVLTDGDILEAIYHDKIDSETTLTESVMRTDVTSINSSTTLEKALEAIVSRRVRRLPVVDEGKLVGLVSLTDIEEFSGYSLTFTIS